MEVPVSDNGLHNPRPQRPSRGDVDQRTWNKGVIVATILAALVVVGAIVWAATNTPQTASNSPPSATEPGKNRPPLAK
jgi:hypothetical protein